MSEIHIKRKVFWVKEEADQKSFKNKLFVIIIIILIILCICLILINREHQDGHFNKSKINWRGIYSRLKRFQNLVSKRNRNSKDNNIDTLKKSFKYLPTIYKKFNPITQSHVYEQDYYYEQFHQHLKEYLFLHCSLKDEMSAEIETYYNFLFNKKVKAFEIANDYAEDYNMFNDNLCFSSGKAHIALKTKEMPQCIQFKNFHINNFYYQNKSNSNILIKFHIFKVKNNKIHIYPVNKQVIFYRHFQKYFSIDHNESYKDKNIILYKESKGDKFVRICNIMSSVDNNHYENKFWLEFNWDPQVQNIICLEDFGYLA